MLTPQRLDGKFNVCMSILWCVVLGSCWISLKTFYIHARKCVIQRQVHHQDGKHLRPVRRVFQWFLQRYFAPIETMHEQGGFKINEGVGNTTWFLAAERS